MSGVRTRRPRQRFVATPPRSIDRVLEQGAQCLLTPADQRWAWDAGRERRRLNIEQGTFRPMNHDGGDPLLIEQLACGWEIAFARMVGVQPVLIKDKWGGKPNGQLPNGKEYGVAHTTNPRGNLLVSYDNNPQASWIFALGISYWPVYEFRGWIPGELLIRHANLKMMRPGEPRSQCYFWSHRALRPILTYW